MSKKDDNSINGLSFENANKELMDLVESLESNEHSLDETMVLFERGQLLSQHCAKLLDNAELKIRQLRGEQTSDLDE